MYDEKLLVVPNGDTNPLKGTIKHTTIKSNPSSESNWEPWSCEAAMPILENPVQSLELSQSSLRVLH